MKLSGLKLSPTESLVLCVGWSLFFVRSFFFLFFLCRVFLFFFCFFFLSSVGARGGCI